MKHKTPSYQRHRFPSEIMSYAGWLYHRFCLSFREVEELLAEQGITVAYETVRQWCQKFGPDYARKLKKRQGRLGDIWHIDDGYCHVWTLLRMQGVLVNNSA
jgi:putative transposase